MNPNHKSSLIRIIGSCLKTTTSIYTVGEYTLRLHNNELAAHKLLSTTELLEGIKNIPLDIKPNITEYHQACSGIFPKRAEIEPNVIC